MDASGIISQILTSAGFAGALLLVLGWAYWKKDRSEKATQVALVKLSERHASFVSDLHVKHSAQLAALADKRIEDAHRVLTVTQSLTKDQNQAITALAVTNAEVAAGLLELRRDVRKEREDF